MSTKTPVQVFLSYCEQDTAWVEKFLLPKLQAANIDIIEFVIGRPKVLEIERAINETKFTLMVISKNYLKSSWSKFHSILATTSSVNHDTWRGLPIIIQKCSLPPFLSSLVVLDLSEPSEQKWQRLLKTVLGRRYAKGKSRKQSSSKEPAGGSKQYVLQLQDFRERTNSLYTNCKISQPYLSQVRQYSTEIKQYLMPLKNQASEEILDSWGQFDKINLENIFEGLENIEITINKGIRSNSGVQKNTYLRQARQAFSSIEESLRYLEKALKDRM